MSVRVQTYFGVPIPPFKEEKLGAGSVTIRFVLLGRIPSKKNNLQSVVVRKDAIAMMNKMYQDKNAISKAEAMKLIRSIYSKVRPNKDYLAFVQKQKPVLQSQMAEWSARLQHKGLIFPISKAAVSLRFYQRHRHLSDTVNRQQSIQDLLIEAGVIVNDDYRTLNPITSASACYYEEVNESITVISLSFRL